MINITGFKCSLIIVDKACTVSYLINMIDSKTHFLLNVNKYLIGSVYILIDNAYYYIKDPKY